MKVFGQRLRELRTEKNLSCEKLGKQLGVSRATIAGWERDEKETSFDMLVSLARVLGTDPDYLLGFEKESQIVDLKEAFCKQYNTELWEMINRLWSVSMDTKRIHVSKADTSRCIQEEPTFWK